MVIFHSYVKLPEGKIPFPLVKSLIKCTSSMASGRPVLQCWKSTAALAELAVGRAIGPARMCAMVKLHRDFHGLWSS